MLLLDDSQNVALAEDDVLVAVDLHLCARVLAEDDAIPHLHLDGQLLTVAAFPPGENGSEAPRQLRCFVPVFHALYAAPEAEPVRGGVSLLGSCQKMKCPQDKVGHAGHITSWNTRGEEEKILQIQIMTGIDAETKFMRC